MIAHFCRRYRTADASHSTNRRLRWPGSRQTGSVLCAVTRWALALALLPKTRRLPKSCSPNVRIVTRKRFHLGLVPSERAKPGARALARQRSVQRFDGTGYLLFPGLTKLGDSAVTIAGPPAHCLWRMFLAVSGAASYYAALAGRFKQVTEASFGALFHGGTACEGG